MFAVFFIVIIAIGWTFSYVYNDPFILLFAVIFSSVMSIISYWKSDRIVLRMSRAKPVTRESARELYNIVENLCFTTRKD